jgi:hypothetical protein
MRIDVVGLSNGLRSHLQDYWNLSTIDNSRAQYTKEDVFIAAEIEVSDDVLRSDLMDALLSKDITVVEKGTTLMLTWGQE